MSEYYTVSGSPSTGSSGASAPIRSEFSLISAGFDKLPTINNSADLPVFVNSGATALTTVSASAARAKLGLSIGNNVQAYSPQLDSLAAVGSGIVVTTGSNNVAARTVTGTANEITVTNGNGVAGNIALSLPSSLTLTGKTVTGGTFVNSVLTTPTIQLTNANAMLFAGAAGNVVQTAPATNGQILIGSTGAAPVLGTLTAGTGITITNAAGSITIAAGAIETVFAAAPNTDFDLTNGGAGGAVTIISKSVTGIAAGDRIEFSVWCTILNNSSANRNYSPNALLGTLSINPAASAFVVANNATSRASISSTSIFSVSATNLTYGQYSQFTEGATLPGNLAGMSTAISLHGWNSSTSDLTGTQTLNFAVSSSANNVTQTLTLHSYTIKKISTK